MVLTLTLFPSEPSPSCLPLALGVSTPAWGGLTNPQTSLYRAFIGLPRAWPRGARSGGGGWPLAVIPWGSKHNPHKLGDLSG